MYKENCPSWYTFFSLNIVSYILKHHLIDTRKEIRTGVKVILYYSPLSFVIKRTTKAWNVVNFNMELGNLSAIAMCTISTRKYISHHQLGFYPPFLENRGEGAGSPVLLTVWHTNCPSFNFQTYFLMIPRIFCVAA